MESFDALPRIRTAMLSALEELGLGADGDVDIRSARGVYEVTVELGDSEHHALARRACFQAAQRVKAEVAADIRIMP